MDTTYHSCLTYQASYSPALPDPSLITFDEPSRMFTVSGQDPTWSGTYTITVAAYYFDGASANKSFDVDFIITDNCSTSTITLDEHHTLFSNPFIYYIDQPT